MARLRSPVAPPEAAKRLADMLERGIALGLADQAGAGNRAGIDHRIERMVFGIEPDGIKGIAGGLDPDRALHLVGPERVEREREYEGFRDRLDREGYARVADL